MIKAVIFDLDNTLVDFMTMKENALEAAVTAMIDAGLKLDSGTAKKELYAIYDSTCYLFPANLCRSNLGYDSGGREEDYRLGFPYLDNDNDSVCLLGRICAWGIGASTYSLENHS